MPDYEDLVDAGLIHDERLPDPTAAEAQANRSFVASVAKAILGETRPTPTASYQQIQFSDADVVEIGDWIPAGVGPHPASNPHNVRPWLFHDSGFVLGVVFADNDGDALGILADSGKIDHFKVDVTDKHDRNDYMTTDPDEMEDGLDVNCPEYVGEGGVKFWWLRGRMPAFLGNASEPYDIDNVSVLELPNPPLSFAACFEKGVDK